MLYWLNGQQRFKFIVLLNCFRIIERHLIGFYDRFNCLELKTKKKPWKKIKWIFMEERFYRCRLELQWGDIIMMIKIIVVILTGLETMRMNWSLILSRPQDKSQLNPARMILLCWWTVSSKEGNILFRSILNSTWLINCFWNVALPLDKIPFKYWIACLSSQLVANNFYSIHIEFAYHRGIGIGYSIGMDGGLDRYHLLCVRLFANGMDTIC